MEANTPTMSENAAGAGAPGTAAHTAADAHGAHTQEALYTAPASDPAPAPAPPAAHKRTHADSPEDDSAAPRRRPRFAAEDRERGRRMLGMLNSTLVRAFGPRQPRRHESAPALPAPPASAPHGAGSTTYDAERRAHDEERAAVRKDLAVVRELAERLVELELAHKAARSQARRLSSFLVTRGGGSAMPPRADPATYAAISAAYTAGMPLVRPRGSRGTHEVYYLPRTLLPEQEDALDQQEERTDDALDAADDEWERERSAMQAELAGAKHRLQQLGVSWK